MPATSRTALALELYDNTNFGAEVDEKSSFLDAKLVSAVALVDRWGLVASE